MKKINLILIIAALGWTFSSNAQTVVAGINPTNLSCGGGNVNLTALGNSTVPVFGNDFNNGNIGAGWSSTASAQFNNPCGAAMDGSTYLWMGPGTAAPRELTTAPVDVSCGGTVCFDFKFVCEQCGDSSPCEGADTYAEGVSLQCSTDGGATWIDFAYFAPNGDLLTSYPGAGVASPYASGATPFTTWQNYCFTIPAGCETNSTMFQLHQWGSSGPTWDHWGIDNFFVYANPCAPFYYDWDHIPGFPDAPDVSTNVTQTTTFEVCYTNGTLSACESVTVTVESIDITSLVTGVEPCLGDNAGTMNVSVTGGAAPYTYTLAGPTPGTNGTGNFSNLAPGNYTVTITDAGTCVVDSSFTIAPGPACCTLTATSTDALCFGQASGTGTANPANGVAPYSYQWDAGTGNQITQTANNLLPGNYSVTITDFNGCTSVTNIVVGQPAVLATTSAPTDVSCFGVCDGQIVVAAPTGGTAPYEYNIGGGTFGASGTFAGLCAGNYNVIAQDDNGCQVIMNNIPITEPTDLTLVEVSTVPATCGANNGELTVLAGGGTVVYMYDIGGGQQASPIFANLASGTYTVTVTDGNNCTETVNVTVASSAGPVPFVDILNDVTCFGGLNGSVTINPGGTAIPYLFSLDAGPNQASNTFAVSAGPHSVTVEDVNGCTGVVNFVIGTPTALTYSTVITDVSCFGVCDGEIAISVPVGSATAPYSYSDDNGLTYQLTSPLTGLCAGNVNVVVSDANGCLANSVEVVGTPALLTSGSAFVEPSCNGLSDGEISFTPVGGTPTYSFSSDNGTTFSASTPLVGIAAGTYDIVVQDGNGCLFNDQITVTEPPAFNFNFVANNPSNCGASDGSFEITATNGIPNYVYSIDGGITTQVNNGFFLGLFSGLYSLLVVDGNGCADSILHALSDNVMTTAVDAIAPTTCFNSCDGATIVSQVNGAPPFTYTINTGGSQGNGIFTGLCAGQHFITIADNGLCIGIQEVNILQPDSITFNLTGVDPLCPAGADGTVTASGAIGGDGGPYTYSIDGGTTFQAGTVFAGLTVGNYTVLAQDPNGCLGSETVTLGEPPAFNVVVNSADLTCFNNNTGFIQIIGGGATGPYTYDLSGTPSGTGIYAGLAAANPYNITVTDANLCVYTTTQIINEPALLTAGYVGVDPLCNGGNDGQFTVTAGGGTPPYIYSSDNGTVITANNVLANLTVGCYDVYVEDDNGCTVVSNECLTEPTPVTMTMVFTPETCGQSNATIDVTGAGGTPGYTYSNDGGTSFQAATLFAGLNVGNFVIVVEDLNGCQIDSLVTTTADNTPVIDNIVSTDPTCFGFTDGDITVTSSGGIGVHTYSLALAGPYVASNVFNTLGDGTYDVYVQDGNGCIATVQVILTQPAQLTLASVATDLLCNGDFTGEITITVGVGTGTAPYQYSIDNGTTLQGGGTFSFIAADPAYALLIEDANGCQVTGVQAVTEPAVLTLAAVPTDPICFNDCNGTVTTAVAGGTAGFTYNWSGNIATSVDANAASVCAGTYSVNVTDLNGCQAEVTNIVLNNPAALVIPGLTTTDVLCFGGTTGTITIDVPTTGTAPYNYSIDGGTTMQLGNTFGDAVAGNPGAVLGIGNYDIVVTDDVGCVALSNTTIYEPTLVYSLAPSDWPPCYGATVEVQGFTNGGTVPYTFEWTNTLNANIETNATFPAVITAAVTYTLVATDANGCPAAAVSYTITPTSQLFPDFIPDAMICLGDSVTLTAGATGGELIDFNTYLGYSYVWNPGAAGDTLQSLTVSPAVPTQYDVTITDFCGAVVDTFVNVGIYLQPTIDIVGLENGCAPDTMYISDSQFAAGSTVLWDFGNGITSTDLGTVEVAYADAGCYDVSYIVTSADGCVTSQTITDAICIYDDPIPGFYTNPWSPSILDPTIEVVDISENAATYYYTFDGYGSSSEAQPTFTFPIDEEATVTVCQYIVSANNCPAEICLDIDIHEIILFYVPNVFTPDGDIYNETFKPVFTSGVDPFEYHLTLFNRWGEIVFESFNYDFGWDGHYGNGGLVKDGVYIWQIEFGEKLSDKKQTHRGHVTVLK